MAKFRVEYKVTGAEWAEDVVFVTVCENSTLTDVEQFVEHAKNPKRREIPDLQTAWKDRQILRVEKVAPGYTMPGG